MFGQHPKFYHEYDLLNHMYDIADEDGCILTVLDEDTLKGIPHVETPVIHAHWIKTYNHIKCSNCGVVFFNQPSDKFKNYCSNCGAKMDEEVSE